MSDVPPKPTTRLAKIEPPKKILTLVQRERIRARAFQPLAIELGWIVYQWNRLQQALVDLFGDVVDSKPIGVAWAIWHSTPSDRTQRDMLRAALKSAEIAKTVKPQAVEDIDWLLNQLNPLAGRRNDALHAPLAFFFESTDEEEKVEIVPLWFMGNPRAAGLKGKSLVDEFKWYRDHLMRLADFAEKLHFAMIFSEYSWPEKPQLLSRGQFRSPAPKRRKSKSK